MGRPVQTTNDLRDLLYRGATARQLGILFGVATATAESRMAKVSVNGDRGGLPIYLVKDAAPHLVPLPADAVERVIRMNHMGLPPALRKEFWQGQQAQLRVLAEQGDLWRTDAVIAYVGAAFRDVATEIKLLGDAIERDTVLSEAQRNTMESLIADVLEKVQKRITETFEGAFDDPAGQNAGHLLGELPGGTSGDGHVESAPLRTGRPRRLDSGGGADDLDGGDDEGSTPPRDHGL